MSECGEDDMSRVPLLAILGSTGCGKSRLAIELARRFFGEIISADSMQWTLQRPADEILFERFLSVYKGLDVVTAKVTKEEQAMAPHHMLDIVDPLTPNFTVVQFRDAAISIIDDLLARGKLPVIVGGTNYYIESALWRILVDQNGKRTRDRIQDDGAGSGEVDDALSSERTKVEIDRCLSTSNEELFNRLVEVDPEMANRLHPNNRRKILRSLEVFEQHGVKHSELLRTQRIAGGSSLGGPLRHQNCIILWLRCELNVLKERLDSRVDAMLETGLVQELLDFHRRYNEQRIKSNTSADYTTGIFQSIGFKEFHDYLVLSEEERREKKGEELLKKGIEDLKMVTKRYARKQEKWVMNRIIRPKDRQVPPVYALDCTDLNQWNSNVYQPAVAIIEAVLRGEKPEQTPLNEVVKNQKFSDNSNEEKNFCEVCNRIFIGDQWNIHLKSVKHKKVLQKKRRLEQQEELEAHR